MRRKAKFLASRSAFQIAAMCVEREHNGIHAHNRIAALRTKSDHQLLSMIQAIFDP